MVSEKWNKYSSFAIEFQACSVLGAAGSCAFEGLLASCHKTLGGIPVQATAVINHCHEPIDITFILQSSHDYNVSSASHQVTDRLQTP